MQTVWMLLCSPSRDGSFGGFEQRSPIHQGEPRENHKETTDCLGGDWLAEQHPSQDTCDNRDDVGNEVRPDRPNFSE